MLKKVLLFALLLFSTITPVFAAPCGNGVCQFSQSETCITCPADCGTCTTPTPTPTPTLTPTPTPTPTMTSSPTPNPTGTSSPTPTDTSSTSENTSNNSSSESSTPTPTPLPPLASISTPILPNSPTDNQNPVVSGVFESTVPIRNVEVSLDNGASWLTASINGNKYRFVSPTLEDGNYRIVVRITDVFGRIITSETQTLVVDIIPPIVGGVSFSTSSQTLLPDPNGELQIARDSQIKYTISTRGGVVGGNVVLGTQTFALEQIPGTNYFYANINPSTDGVFPLEISAVDGAGRTTTRTMNNIEVLSSGSVTPGAKVSVYYFENDSNSWVLWNGSPLGQNNPQVTADDGSYSFILPKGKYYIEVKKSGNKKAVSEIFNVEGTSLINFNYSLVELKRISIGPVSFHLPSLTPPSSFKVGIEKKSESTSKSTFIGKVAPDILISKDQKVDTSSYYGKQTIITFVSTWSNNVSDQIDKIQKLVTDPSINTIVVFVQDSPSVAANFVARGKYTFNYIVDKNGYSAEKYGITSLPQSFILDKNWVVKNVYYSLIPDSLN